MINSQEDVDEATSYMEEVASVFFDDEDFEEDSDYEEDEEE